jgi:hypothetical protein
MSRFSLLFVLLGACAGGEPVKAPEPATTEAAPAPAPAPVDAAALFKAAPSGAKVMFLEPAEGATVKSPFKIKFGVEGATVQPAGTLAEGTGHHHLIVNGSAVEAGKMVPKDETHIHFGKGDTETELSLTPGDYTLTMQFADGNHMSYGETLSATLHLKVE